jgi:hypothetical protein
MDTQGGVMKRVVLACVLLTVCTTGCGDRADKTPEAKAKVPQDSAGGAGLPQPTTILGLPVASVRVPASVPVREVTEDGRVGWLLHARSELQLELPPGASELSIWYGLAKASYTGKVSTDGAKFSISILRSDGQSQLLWTRRLDPRAETGDRGMHLESITFTPATNARLVLETDPGTNGVWDWTLWADLQVK